MRCNNPCGGVLKVAVSVSSKTPDSQTGWIFDDCPRQEYESLSSLSVRFKLYRTEAIILIRLYEDAGCGSPLGVNDG